MTKKQPTYQELKDSLDEVLLKIQSDDTSIDEAVTLHAQGQKILQELDTYLQVIAERAEIDIQKL